MNRRTATFTPDRTLDLLRDACRMAGLDPSGARLLRHHTNAVYRLQRHPIVVKITRPGANLSRIIQTVALATALAEAGVPSIRIWPDLSQPITVDDSHCTFWSAIDVVREPVASDLAEPLRGFHQLGLASGFDLPVLDPFAAIVGSLHRSTVLNIGDLDFLHDYACKLGEDYEAVRFDHPDALIHGDAHHSNTLISSNGPVLADLESACAGPPEWDLVTLAVHCRRFGHPDTEYRDFTTAYGFDIEKWSGYSTLAAVRELRMITTNAWKSAPGTPAASEVERRVQALRAGQDDVRWRLL